MGASVEAFFTLFDNNMGNIVMFGLNTSKLEDNDGFGLVCFRVCVFLLCYVVCWPLLGLGPEFP